MDGRDGNPKYRRITSLVENHLRFRPSQHHTQTPPFHAKAVCESAPGGTFRDSYCACGHTLEASLVDCPSNSTRPYTSPKAPTHYIDHECFLLVQPKHLTNETKKLLYKTTTNKIIII